MWKASPAGIVTATSQYLQSKTAVDMMGIDSVLNTPDPTQPKTRISHRTAERWLHKLGWIYGRNKKGYVDGHERPDVVDYRQNVFCPRMQELLVTLREYDDSREIPKDLPPGTKRRHLVTHDESTFNANDGSLYSWKIAGQEWLKPKSRGKGLMVSEFLLAADGRLACNAGDDELTGRIYASETIQYGSGKNDDGWWNAEKMIAQTKKAINIFNKSHPDDIAVFAFDNSSGHACKAPDALVAARMNLNPGGKKPTMHDTVMADGTPQSMVFKATDCQWESTVLVSDDLVGRPKGMKRVLQERGLWQDGLKKQCGREKKKKTGNSGFGDRLFDQTMEDLEARDTDKCEEGKTCCALRILEAQPDFKNEISLLESVITAAGHEVIFYPKFHCELNYIEYYWAAVKRYTRDHCQYTFSELPTTVAAGLESVSIQTIRRFAMRSKRWLMAYINGLTKEQREYAEKKYQSHRRETRKIFV